MMLRVLLPVLASLVFVQAGLSQVQFPWPVTPFDQNHEITGNFAEFRDTGTSDHFHNGTDIPKPDGSPVYPVKDGVITSMSSAGSNAFVRVEDVAYVHIFPNPALAVGDSVFASETVLGTILSGLGHVHFTNGFLGSEKNSMLVNSGLTPLEDPWPPIIRFVQFYQNNSNVQFTDNRLSGLVDIHVKVDEQNGPPSSSISRRNNGTYKIGYKILSADTSSVVFEPPNNGIRFQFDTKPSNTFVHRVYSNRSTLTSHIYIVTNNITSDNFWNTAAFPNGHYVVMVFTEDTRMNTDTVYVQVETTEADFTPPAQPVLRFTKETDTGGFTIGWFPNTDADLLGYRIYFSRDNEIWNLWRGEEVLKAGVQDTTLESTLNTDIYFRLTAVDDAPLPNESIPSDTYGLSNGDFSGKVLIVDGFDRTDGAWTQPNHAFAFEYGKALIANDYSIDTVPNESVIDSTVNLSDYQAVVWFLGDEAHADETFSHQEQQLVEDYLQRGGSLFVSGAKIAWDLDVDSPSAATPDDDAFFHTYLHADYQGQMPQPENMVGKNGSIFDGLVLDFDPAAYLPDSFDVITPFGQGSQAVLEGGGQVMGIQYAGTVAGGSAAARLVYLTVPFEILGNREMRAELMGRILTYFFPTTAVAQRDDKALANEEFQLLPNYPNPFNPETTVLYNLPTTSRVRIDIFNINGRLVKELFAGKMGAGRHKLSWSGADRFNRLVASGIYVIQLHATPVNPGSGQTFTQSRKVLLLR